MLRVRQRRIGCVRRQPARAALLLLFPRRNPLPQALPSRSDAHPLRRPDVDWAELGTPKQERWIHHQRALLKVPDLVRCHFRFPNGMG
jgi:hypothetical protein